ncbi:MAG: HD family hydrolase [Candidatus Poribacteria bacterium]|nr:HD family hydrolase [Candidatus Poribacteria bacterium]MDE0505729.1 HD family hydrolase [Candidatus Poribacteria bacterium]
MALNAQAILDFIEEMAVLKNLPRTGWRFQGIKDGESVADHCYRVSLLSMILADMLATHGVRLDAEKVMRMALLHEVAEARIGDIPFPALEYIPENVKERGEDKAVKSMFEEFGTVGEKYIEIWEEFESNSSVEGQVVRAADKLELMIQAYEYEKVGYRSLDKFWGNNSNWQGVKQFAQIQEILDLLLERRQEVLGTCVKRLES